MYYARQQLALHVTIYSLLLIAGDFPDHFRKYPDAFQFIKEVLDDCDDTKVLDAEPGEIVTIARKQKGKPNWFLGTMTDENSRNSRVSFVF